MFRFLFIAALVVGVVCWIIVLKNVFKKNDDAASIDVEDKTED